MGSTRPVFTPFPLKVVWSGISLIKGHNTQHSGHTDQNELVAEIYSKSLVRAIGKVLLMKFS